MSQRRRGRLITFAFVLCAGAGLAGCQTDSSGTATAAPAQGAAAQTAAPVAPARPMTREQASTDCWMKYEKEGRGLSLDQRLPLVEKCTTEKMKAAAR